MNILEMPFNIASRAYHNMMVSLGRLKSVEVQTDSSYTANVKFRQRTNLGYSNSNTISKNSVNENIEKEFDNISRSIPMIVPYKGMFVDLLSMLHDELIDPVSGDINPMKIFTFVSRILGIKKIEVQLEPDAIAGRVMENI